MLMKCSKCQIGICVIGDDKRTCRYIPVQRMFKMFGTTLFEMQLKMFSEVSDVM